MEKSAYKNWIFCSSIVTSLFSWLISPVTLLKNSAKMKVVLFLAAAVLAVYGAPTPQAIDWVVILSKVDQIEAAVTGAVETVITTAKEDDSRVGLDIESKLALPLILAQVVIEQTRVPVRAQVLTEESAKRHFAELKTILTNVTEDLATDLAQLSSAAREKINTLFLQAEAVSERLANDIYVLLADEDPGTGIDWTAVDNKVEEIRATVVGSIAEASDAALSDDPILGAVVQIQLANSEKSVHIEIGRMKGSITSHTLTKAEAQYFLLQIQSNINNIQEVIREDVSHLSPGAQQKISTALNNAVTQVQVKTQEVLALLEPPQSTTRAY